MTYWTRKVWSCIVHSSDTFCHHSFLIIPQLSLFPGVDGCVLVFPCGTTCVAPLILCLCVCFPPLALPWLVAHILPFLVLLLPVRLVHLYGSPSRLLPVHSASREFSLCFWPCLFLDCDSVLRHDLFASWLWPLPVPDFEFVVQTAFEFQVLVWTVVTQNLLLRHRPLKSPF